MVLEFEGQIALLEASVLGTGSENTTDTVPVQGTTVSVLEMDRSLRVIAQTPYAEDFRDGDSFTYTSIVGTPEGAATFTPEEAFSST
jgi:hypothetical protein